MVTLAFISCIWICTYSSLCNPYYRTLRSERVWAIAFNLPSLVSSRSPMQAWLVRDCLPITFHLSLKCVLYTIIGAYGAITKYPNLDKLWRTEMECLMVFIEKRERPKSRNWRTQYPVWTWCVWGMRFYCLSLEESSLNSCLSYSGGPTFVSSYQAYPLLSYSRMLCSSIWVGGTCHVNFIQSLAYEIRGQKGEIGKYQS